MLHTIKNEFLTVTAAEKGAELQSILGADGAEYLWQGDSRYWSDRALNLFPFVARLTEGRYELDGNIYELPIHGFAPERNFTLKENNGTKMVLELTDDAQTLLQYPRHFSFQVIYELAQNALNVCFRVENRDQKPLYFGLGGHPGFNVPLTKGRRFEDYRLRFAEYTPCKRVVFTDDCFPTGEHEPFPLKDGNILPLDHHLFDNDAIVLTDMARQVTLEAENDPHSITVTYPQMPYLGLWHWPKTDAPYLCIEPWGSLPAKAGEITVFEKKEDLYRLQPGGNYENSWSISISVTACHQ